MSTAGPNSPGTLADDNTVGTVTWSGTSNAAASDNSYATAASGTGGSPVTTHYLKATNFSFSIPAGSAIDGILCEVEGKIVADTDVDSTTSVKVVKADGTLSATNKTGGSWTGSDVYYQFGSSTELWGETWTPTDINDSDFGFVISRELAREDASHEEVCSIDHMRITVYYTVAGVNRMMMGIGI